MEKKNRASVSRPVKLLTAVTAVVVVLAILAVLVLNALPDGSLEFDMTANDLYSVTSVTRNKLADLTDSLEVRVFSSESSLDERLVKYLNRYDKLSDKVSVLFVDSVKEPARMSEYGGEDNTIQVCNTATGAVSSFAISGFEGQDAAALLYDYSTYYMKGQLSLTSFDAEGRLASAIDAVTGAEQRTIYYTTGHGETTMASSLTLLLNKANYRQGNVELLTVGGIPEDCDLLIINAPTSDLSNDELQMLERWLTKGGKLFIICDRNDLPNFSALLLTYGIQTENGYLADPQNYYPSYAEKFGYYCFHPVYNEDSEICSGVSASGMVIGAVPLSLVQAERRSSETEYFMCSSESGVNYSSDTGDNPEYSIYYCGVVATEQLDDETSSRLTVISSAYFASEDLLSSFTNLSNLTILQNAVNANFDGASSNTAIGAKSMALSYNTLTNTTFYSVFFMAVVPLAFLAVGLVCWTRRRKR